MNAQSRHLVFVLTLLALSSLGLPACFMGVQNSTVSDSNLNAGSPAPAPAEATTASTAPSDAIDDIDGDDPTYDFAKLKDFTITLEKRIILPNNLTEVESAESESVYSRVGQFWITKRPSHQGWYATQLIPTYLTLKQLNIPSACWFKIKYSSDSKHVNEQQSNPNSIYPQVAIPAGTLFLKTYDKAQFWEIPFKYFDVSRPVDFEPGTIVFLNLEAQKRKPPFFNKVWSKSHALLAGILCIGEGLTQDNILKLFQDEVVLQRTTTH